MANIDTSSIENFDGMTPEEQVKALLGMEIPEAVDMSGYVLKDVFDRKATEAANLSKQLKAKADEARALMSEEQQKQAALAEAAEADKAEKEELKARIAELEKNNTLREYTMSFSGLGLDEKAAADTAKAMADGNSVKVFENLRKFLESYKKSIEAELMSKTPRPDGAGHGEDGKESAAIAKAKQLFGAQSGTNQNYASVMGNYIKK